ncbi:MAG: sigma-70 family RNA polymerase sigma factor [Clostridia bacterium]|nr:sigma-70 family RNA polymerase sigma factor [Clostridia bacterium]
MDDNKIIALYFERSEDAIAESEKKYGKYCYKIAKNILTSHEDVEECVSDTWLKAWGVIPPQRPKKLSAFFGTITRNLALNRVESIFAEKRGGVLLPILDELAEILPADGGEEETVDAIVMKDAINSFLASLSPEVRKIFLQRYWYCRSVKEIARDFGRSENDLYVILHRTRKDFKAHLDKKGVYL